MTGQRFDVDLLHEDPFEVDAQAAHLFKHPNHGLQDVYDVWVSDPLFYRAKPPAHWLRCAEVDGRALVVPMALLAPLTPAVVSTHRLARGSRWPRPPIPERPMTNPTMTPDEEHEFYSRPDHQEPQGPPRRRSHRLTAPIPVRFPPELLEEIRRRAADDDRSVSSWIRRAVEHELRRPA